MSLQGLKTVEKLRLKNKIDGDFQNWKKSHFSKKITSISYVHFLLIKVVAFILKVKRGGGGWWIVIRTVKVDRGGGESKWKGQGDAGRFKWLLYAG